MDFYELLRKKELSRYTLSKKSGVQWNIIADLYTGKLSLHSLKKEMQEKLAEALELTTEELLALEKAKSHQINGKPENRIYLECSLPEKLAKTLQDYKQGKTEQMGDISCLRCRLCASIRDHCDRDEITREQAEYLRKCYLLTPIELGVSSNRNRKKRGADE